LLNFFDLGIIIIMMMMIIIIIIIIIVPIDQSCDLTYVYAVLRSQSMVIMDYLVATLDDIHAITS